MQRNPSLLSLPGQPWPRVVEPYRVLAMGQIELNCVITLNWIVWKNLFLHLTVYKQKNIIIKTELFEIELFVYKNGFDIE